MKGFFELTLKNIEKSLSVPPCLCGKKTSGSKDKFESI